MGGMTAFGKYMKQGEMSAAQAIAKRKDEAARRARGVM